MFKRASPTRRLSFLPGALAFIAVALCAHTASAQLTINGAGATFPYPLYSKWFDSYAKVDGSVRFNYQSIGSGGGQKQILDETVDFGATDGPMTDETLAKAPGKLLHIPTVAGAVAITYNVPGLKELRLDGETLAGIYLGKITRWNDPAIAAINPGLALPSTQIAVVHRSDGSGSSLVFTEYLSSVCAEWKQRVGRNASVKWPVGLGAKGNEGVAGQVKQIRGAIGYVELIYTQQTQMAVAALKNKAGEFVLPTVAGMTNALQEAQVPDDFRFSTVNLAGPGSYPLTAVTWLLVYEKQKDPAKGQKLVQFLSWMLVDGEKSARELSYAPLPSALIERVRARVATIQF